MVIMMNTVNMVNTDVLSMGVMMTLASLYDTNGAHFSCIVCVACHQKVSSWNSMWVAVVWTYSIGANLVYQANHIVISSLCIWAKHSTTFTQHQFYFQKGISKRKGGE